MSSLRRAWRAAGNRPRPTPATAHRCSATPPASCRGADASVAPRTRTTRCPVPCMRSYADGHIDAPPGRSLRAQWEPPLPTDPRFRALAFLAVLAACGDDSAGRVDEFSRADAADSACPTHLDMTLLAESARSESGWTGRAYGIGPPA